jgi:hypothetical protein
MDDREKYLQQLSIAHLGRIEGDFDRFGMAGIAAADQLIGGVDAAPPL